MSAKRCTSSIIKNEDNKNYYDNIFYQHILYFLSPTKLPQFEQKCFTSLQSSIKKDRQQQPTVSANIMHIKKVLFPATISVLV